MADPNIPELRRLLEAYRNRGKLHTPYHNLAGALVAAADFLLRAAEERDAYANGTLKWIQDKETD